MKFGVVVFPGTWSDVDCFDVIHDVLKEPVEYVWHKDTDLSAYDCIILPGGFSYGDYLRCGAIARFSPVMKSVAESVEQGKLVIGICNGFQILCEAGLLPGVLRANDHLQFRCQWTDLRVENQSTPFTSTLSEGQVISVPISHGEGNYFADPETLAMLERDNRVAFRYCGPAGEVTSEFNPNGSMNNIAGITNAQGNVLGMMPHPERCCDEILGGVDGTAIFESMARWASGDRMQKVQETTA
ncbi:MAG: phosphoribosylformylglycinamidine synthase I [SAR202 cluster bacterium Casp-Chloro-G4]|nr:phosphoribosylformylglycinamidine synthase subunit PurQ [Chloroflexota bacterium]MDA1228405.1 phosphoribosylformylglycinamidine synthase subunit PurQ [Chloroflexota bacterium]PKB62118.1 MAG: phosphoribosylformylglycinamidine synthase I [SAR202 cluster bacterium Casp-Chloro-G4]